MTTQQNANRPVGGHGGAGNGSTVSSANGYKVVYTNSEMTAFKTCRLKHHFAYREGGTGIKPRVEKDSLSFGKLLHRAFYFLYDQRPTRDGLQNYFMDIVEQEILAFRERNPHATFQDVGDFHFREAQGLAVLSAYYDWAAQHDAGFEVLESEGEFRVKVKTKDTGRVSSRFEFAGKRDGVWRRKSDGTIWIFELKTKSSFGDLDVAELQRSEQALGYIWSYQEQTGQEVAGCIFQIIKRSNLKKLSKVKDGDRKEINPETGRERQVYREETDEEFQQRVIADYAARPDHYFQRHFITYSRSEIRAFGERLHQVCQELTNPAIYRSPGMHCRWCDYADLCLRDEPEIREDYLPKDSRHEELELVA